MRALIITAISIVGLLITGSTVYADNNNDPGTNKRQQIQKNRIKEGLRSGELTVHETLHLRKQQQHINRLERAYKSDGHLTRSERHNLHRAQNKTSRQIYKKKHNGRVR